MEDGRGWWCTADLQLAFFVRVVHMQKKVPSPYISVLSVLPWFDLLVNAQQKQTTLHVNLPRVIDGT